MRTVSMFTILMLCLAIIIVDVLAFYWLHDITSLIASPFLVTLIHVLFWTFTIGLVVAIVVLKMRLDDMDPRRKHRWISSLYGLTVSSLVPKLLFVIVISILFFTNQLFSESESRFIIPMVGLLSGFLPFFFILYGIFKAAYRFKIYHHNIVFQELPKAFDGLKIVQLSDIHVGSFNYRFHILKKAVSKIHKIAPDILVITGDLVNNYAWELRGWEPVFQDMPATIGKFAILGNHDYGDYSQWPSEATKRANFDAIKTFYDDTGFDLLLNTSKRLNIKDDHISLVGVENWGKPPFKQYGDLTKALENTETGEFKILLSHDPSHWSEEVLPNTDIALTLSGHTHGMQAGFQRKNFQWSPIQYNYKHWAGLYHDGAQYLYVNRGLGWLGFPGRLGMRPEITVLELRCA